MNLQFHIANTTVSNSNIPIQTYFLFSRPSTTPFHHHSIYYAPQARARLIRPHIALNTNNNFEFTNAIHTYHLFVQGRNHTAYGKKAHSRHYHHCSVIRQHIRARLRPHIVLNIYNNFKFKPAPMHTYRLFIKGQHDDGVSYVQRK